jgi:hypothetical protein
LALRGKPGTIAAINILGQFPHRLLSDDGPFAEGERGLGRISRRQDFRAAALALDPQLNAASLEIKQERTST